MVDGVPAVADLRDKLRELPCGAALLDAAVPGTYLVGGAVRDLLRGEEPHELDVAVVGDPSPLMGALGGEPRQHERFGTASVRLGDCRVDVAIARAERYPSPGALPEVWPAQMEDDLARRDFTVNAIALELVDGTTRAAPHALDDLRDGLLRVLHDRSFLDDPTRLWRLARYRARLDFAVEERTARLAREAVVAGALLTVSGTRIGNELRLALEEDDPVAALQSAVELGLAPWLDPDRARIARALEILPAEGDRALSVLAAAAHEQLPELGFTAGATRAVEAARRLRSAPRPGATPSEAASAFDGAPVEAIAASGTPEAERWLRTDRHRRLAITGDDLLAAGIPAGPELGRRLTAARAALLDGEVGDDRAAQLEVALASPA
jgi:tRNA nucleotidyltransferase (CCA-adding enzyme)